MGVRHPTEDIFQATSRLLVSLTKFVSPVRVDDASFTDGEHADFNRKVGAHLELVECKDRVTVVDYDEIFVVLLEAQV